MTHERKKRLAREAKRLNLAIRELSAVTVRNLLAEPQADFKQAAKHVLNKNRELYQRLR